jgi:anti-anti-sigma factor
MQTLIHHRFINFTLFVYGYCRVIFPGFNLKIYIMLEVEQYNNKFYLSFHETDKFNLYNARQVEMELMQYVSKPSVSVTLNLNEVSFIDSSAFETLLNVLRSAKINNTDFELAHVSEGAMELIKIMQLDNVFNIRPNNNNR